MPPEAYQRFANPCTLVDVVSLASGSLYGPVHEVMALKAVRIRAQVPFDSNLKRTIIAVELPDLQDREATRYRHVGLRQVDHGHLLQRHRLDVFRRRRYGPTEDHDDNDELAVANLSDAAPQVPNQAHT